MNGRDQAVRGWDPRPRDSWCSALSCVQHVVRARSNAAFLTVCIYILKSAFFQIHAKNNTFKGRRQVQWTGKNWMLQLMWFLVYCMPRHVRYGPRMYEVLITCECSGVRMYVAQSRGVIDGRTYRNEDECLWWAQGQGQRWCKECLSRSGSSCQSCCRGHRAWTWPSCPSWPAGAHTWISTWAQYIYRRNKKIRTHENQHANDARLHSGFLQLNICANVKHTPCNIMAWGRSSRHEMQLKFVEGPCVRFCTHRWKTHLEPRAQLLVKYTCNHCTTHSLIHKMPQKCAMVWSGTRKDGCVSGLDYVREDSCAWRPRISA